MHKNDIASVYFKLWKTFWIVITFPLLLFIAVVIIHQFEIKVVPPGSIRVWGIFLFVFSVAFGAAFPVLFRTSFHGKFIKNNSTTPSVYLGYQRNLILVSSIAIVFASFAYLFIVSPLYMYGSLLAALYGVYSVLPFKDKIKNELSLYKLRTTE